MHTSRAAGRVPDGSTSLWFRALPGSTQPFVTGTTRPPHLSFSKAAVSAEVSSS